MSATKSYDEMTLDELTKVIRGFRSQEHALREERGRAEKVFFRKSNEGQALESLSKLTPEQLDAYEATLAKVRAMKAADKETITQDDVGEMPDLS